MKKSAYRTFASKAMSPTSAVRGSGCACAGQAGCGCESRVGTAGGAIDKLAPTFTTSHPIRRSPGQPFSDGAPEISETGSRSYWPLGAESANSAVLSAKRKIELPKPGDPIPTCSCYYSMDCLDGYYCTGPQPIKTLCRRYGKNDGVCKKDRGAGEKAPVMLYSRSALVDAVHLVFRAYDRASLRYRHTHEQQGGPDETLWREIDRVAASPDVANTARKVVHDVLDIVLGFDFEIREGFAFDWPLDAPMDALPGNIKGVAGEKETRALLRAAQTGVMLAIQRDDVSLIEAPLRAFWEKCPDYHPTHQGRCYPHGHRRFYRSPLECTTVEIAARFRGLLGVGGKV